jgi:hypothetical protein
MNSKRCLVLLALVLATGCGDSRVVPVQGQFVWPDGAPADLETYVVEASVEGSKVTAQGSVDKEGKFTLTTFKPGDGAEPGTHQVIVMPAPRAEFERPPRVKLPARYARAATSRLTIQVERGKPNVFSLIVERK